MPNIPTMPNISGGRRQQRAAQLRAEMESKKKATEQQAAAAKSGAEWHAVKSGETLDGIAAQYGVSPEPSGGAIRRTGHWVGSAGPDFRQEPAHLAAEQTRLTGQIAGRSLDAPRLFGGLSDRLIHAGDVRGHVARPG